MSFDLAKKLLILFIIQAGLMELSAGVHQSPADLVVYPHCNLFVEIVVLLSQLARQS